MLRLLHMVPRYEECRSKSRREIRWNMKIFWVDFKFGPINLWTFPKQYKDWFRMSDAMSDEWFEEVYLPMQKQSGVTSWDYVREDINQREEMGALKYNKYLTPNTSEDMLNHAYNEALDLVVYLRTLILQRDKGYDPNL